jgi:hypothetical protein
MVEVHLEGRGHDGLEPPVDGRKHANGLYVVAHHLASAAHDTLVNVTDNGRGGILTISRFFPFIMNLPDAKGLRQVL